MTPCVLLPPPLLLLRPSLLLLQGVCNGLAVATLSAPNHPPRLMLSPVPASFTGSSSSSDSSSSSWDWSPVQALEPDLSLLPEAAAALADLQCELLDVVPTVGDTDLHFQAVVQVRVASRVAFRECQLPSLLCTAYMQLEVLDLAPTVGGTDLHFQAVVQVGAAL
jgi:hypothetical protein